MVQNISKGQIWNRKFGMSWLMWKIKSDSIILLNKSNNKFQTYKSWNYLNYLFNQLLTNKKTRLVKLILGSKWSKYSLQLGFIVSQLIVGSGEQDTYRKVASSSLSRLVAHSRIFRLMLMYCDLWPKEIALLLATLRYVKIQIRFHNG